MGAGDRHYLDRSWRNNKKSIKSKLGYILNTENAYHDVTFLVGKEQRAIKAHKLILIISSRVFEDILAQETPDSMDGSFTVHLPDVHPAALHCLLKFIYTDTLEVTLEDAMYVLYAAKKFDVPELSDRCIELLKANITEKNVVGVYESAQVNGEDELRDCALQFILRKADNLINSQEFLQLKYEMLCTILERDELFVEELKIFKFVMRWAREECKRFDMDETGENHRYVLKKAIYLLRFPLLNVEQFSTHVVPTGILSSSEMVELYQFFTMPAALRSQLSITNQATMLFNNRPRIQPTYHTFQQKSPQSSPGNSLSGPMSYLNVSEASGYSVPNYLSPAAIVKHQVDSILLDKAKQYSPSGNNTTNYNNRNHHRFQ